MIWNVKNPTKRKSLLERLVNLEEEAAPFEPAAEAKRADDGPSGWRTVSVSTVSDLLDDMHAESEELEDVIQEEESESGRVEENASYTDSVYEVSEPEAPRKKYFDMLERAKERPGDTREEIHLEFTMPKRVYSVPVRADVDESPISDISDISEPASFIERLSIEEPSPVSASVEDVHESEVGGFVSGETGESDEEPVVDNPEILQEPEMVISEPIETIENPYTGEPVRAQRSIAFEKVLFPEEYFYARNGKVMKNIPQLRSALQAMDDGTFAHHATERETNDFANWILHVYRHDECAGKLREARSREEHIGILDSYL